MSDSVDREMTSMTASLRRSIQHVVDRLKDPAVKSGMSREAMEKVSEDVKAMITTLIPAGFEAAVSADQKPSR